MDSKKYYNAVARYFDEDANDFERRYDENPVLKRMRRDFRILTEIDPFQYALEIGCGTGMDLRYFGNKYPDSRLYGIDISTEMVRLATEKVRAERLDNVHVEVGSVEDVDRLFPGQCFDLIYVYFGALNTVHDLDYAASILSRLLRPGGRLVLTVVNRWYLMDVPLFLLKGNRNRAFERVTDRWQGYSPVKSLGSRCYSSRDMKKAFAPYFQLIKKQGYCILYPAWYRCGLLNRLGKWGDYLWKMDRFLNKTVFWNTGEYSLYVYVQAR